MFPFAGIVDKDDIPCDVELEDWLSVAPTDVFLHEITLTQHHAVIEKLFVNRPACDVHDFYIHVGLWNNKMYLYNGHHRAIKAALRGEMKMLARIWEF